MKRKEQSEDSESETDRESESQRGGEKSERLEVSNLAVSKCFTAD